MHHHSMAAARQPAITARQPKSVPGCEHVHLLSARCREAVVADALAARRKLLVTIASGLLSAISYCHQCGVAHCGIGAGEPPLNSPYVTPASPRQAVRHSAGKKYGIMPYLCTVDLRRLTADVATNGVP